jgi:hypothetical protein
MGLFVDKLWKYGCRSKYLNIIFWLFAAACIPAYILSVLWVKIPTVAYVVVVISAFLQVTGWIMMIKIIYKSPQLVANFSLPVKRLFLLAAMALSIKLLLQLGSTIPFLSQLAYGFRPIVIAYLHLVLLGVITLFLIGFIIANDYILAGRKTSAGIFIFTVGIILNEVVLMIQGISNLNYTYIPNTNEALLLIGIIMFAGILLVNISQGKNYKKTVAEVAA